MLDGMRKISQHWIGRAILSVLFGLLIVSFVIWGVGDMFRGFVPDKVAEVGGQSISTQQYQNSLQTVMFRIQSRTHRNLTSAQAHELGIDRQVLGNLIADAALDVRAASLGMAISEASIVAAVRSDPSLQDASGQFNPAALRSGPARFRPQRARLLRRPEPGLHAPADRDAADRRPRCAESRSSTCSPASRRRPARSITSRCRRARRETFPPPPTTFSRPISTTARISIERRNIARSKSCSSIRARSPIPADVSDDDAKADYDKVRDARFATPEKRKLQQIVFPDQASADDAEAKIKAGASFDDIIKARNLKPSDVDLGETTKAAMFDQTIADAAFALPPGRRQRGRQGSVRSGDRAGRQRHAGQREDASTRSRTR